MSMLDPASNRPCLLAASAVVISAMLSDRFLWCASRRRSI